jgi:hypothetical protein
VTRPSYPAPRTVADRIRRAMRSRGIDLAHIDDAELGVRLVSMPAAVADDRKAAARWMRYGTVDEPIFGSIHR